MSSQIVDGITFRDRLTTVDDKGHRKWIRAKKPKGKYYDKKTILSFIYLGVFFLLPFIKIHERPLLLLNIPERKFIIFSYPFWPQDLIIFGLLMVTGVVFVALFTVAFGRIFCGWVCPQTIFMEMVFRKIEYLFEGNPKQQIELKESKWNFNKIWRKLGKHGIFWGLSFIIANTFLAYIISIDKLFLIISEPVSKHIIGFMSLCFFTTVFYTVFAFVREQACTIVCPYGRLQSVLIDSDTVVVAYDYVRGEPRGVQRKNTTDIKGDCIDCKECVKVCPTGIDIRNGTQLECVNCTACIDACDAVMIHMKKPEGLVRYATNNNINSGKQFEFTWRLKGYSIVLTVLLIIISILIVSRKDIDSTVLRAGGLLYQMQNENKISNLYKIKIANKTYKDVKLNVKLKDIPGEIKLVGERGLIIEKESSVDANFFVIIDKSKLHSKKNDIVITILKDNIEIEKLKTTFFAP